MKMYRQNLFHAGVPLAAIVLAGLMVAGSVTNLRADEEKKEALSAEVKEAKEAFIKQDAEMKGLFEKATGYVIFPSVKKGGIGIGGAIGTGQVFEKDKLIGKAKLKQGSVGFQFGGQIYSEVIFFETGKALDEFKKSAVEFSAQVSAVAAKEGASKTAKYANGVLVFTLAKGGLMYEASVGGQKFGYEAY